MPEDRLGDLDPGERRRSAGEQLSDLDAGDEEKSGKDRPDPPPRPGSRYSWVVGVAVFIVIAFATLNAIEGGSGEGTSGPEPGTIVPDFAAPSVTADTEAGPNVAQSGDAPACEVDEEDVVNICELREEEPVVLTFVTPGDLSGDARCEDALDEVERLRPDFPRVTFVGVISGASSDEIAGVLADHDWNFPVADDPDGVLLSTYRVGDCPTTVLAKAGGEVVDTINGLLSEEELRVAAERISRGSSGGSS